MQGDGLLRIEAEAHARRQQNPLRPRLHCGGPHEGAHLVQLINLRSTHLSGIPGIFQRVSAQCNIDCIPLHPGEAFSGLSIPDIFSVRLFSIGKMPHG